MEENPEQGIISPNDMITDQERANGLEPIPALKEACQSVYDDWSTDKANGYYPDFVDEKDMVAFIVVEVYRRYQFDIQGFGEDSDYNVGE